AARVIEPPVFFSRALSLHVGLGLFGFSWRLRASMVAVSATWAALVLLPLALFPSTMGSLQSLLRICKYKSRNLDPSAYLWQVKWRCQIGERAGTHERQHDTQPGRTR